MKLSLALLSMLSVVLCPTIASADVPGDLEYWTNEPYYGTRGTFLADVTGDGKADAIVVNDSGVTVRRSNGSQFLPNETWINVPYYGTRGTFFADVTGDGRADAIVVNDWGVTVRRSNGSQFLPNEIWIDAPYYGTRGTFFADVTGEGRADAIVVNDWGVTVRRSNGSSFLSNETWTGDPYYGEIGTFFADATGDGKADAIALNFWQAKVRRSDGSQFVAAGAPGFQLPYYADQGAFFADVTGDEKADAILLDDQTLTVRPSYWYGQGFSAYNNWPSGFYSGSGEVFFADVTGDGKNDFVVVGSDRITVRRMRADLTVLTLNAMGSGNFADTMPDGSGEGTWQERVDRLASQIAESGVIPDIISLTEFEGWRWCTLMPVASDYDFLDRLISGLQNATGAYYRIAHLVGVTNSFGVFGQCVVFTGNAVLYNAATLVHAPSSYDQSTPMLHHESDANGVGMRRSLPICNRGTNYIDLPNRIDGALHSEKCGSSTPSAPAWAVVVDNGGRIGASLARFSFARYPYGSFDLFTVHPPAEWGPEEAQPIADFVSALSAPPYRDSYSTFPPLIVGDFNCLVTSEPGEPGWPNGAVTLYDATMEGDVMSVKQSQPNVFPVIENLEVVQSGLYPGAGGCPSGTSLDFSDHCAVQARLRRP